MKHKVFWGILLIVLVMLLLVLPWGIREIYSLTFGQTADLRVNELTLYYGALLGALTTVVAVITVIKHGQRQLKMEREHEREQLRNERKLAIKPYLVSRFKQASPYDFAKKTGIQDLYVEINREEISAGFCMPDCVNRVNAAVEKRSGTAADEFTVKLMGRLSLERRYCLINYFLTNAGAGSAIGIELRLNGKKTLSSFALMVNQTINVKFVIDLEALSPEHQFGLEMEYEYADAASIARYRQKEKFVICCEGYEFHKTFTAHQDRDGFLTPSKEIGDVAQDMALS